MNELVQTWFPVLATLGGIIGTIALYFLNSRIDNQVTAAKEEINKRVDHLVAAIEKRADGMNDRIVVLEAHWETLPTRQDFHNMALQFAEMAGDMKAMKAQLGAMGSQMEATQKSVQRVNDYLLNEKAS